MAWITEWVQIYRHNDTPIMDRAVSFTKGAAPAVPNPNYIPLYLAPPKRERLSGEQRYVMYHANKKATHPDSYWSGVYMQTHRWCVFCMLFGGHVDTHFSKR